MSQSSVVLQNATQAIRKGSKSFSAASRLLQRDTRQSVVKLYAWCRHCDDVIDGQILGHFIAGAGTMGDLKELEGQTRQAYEAEPLRHPTFAGLQEVVRRHGIPRRYPLDLIDGFRMDVLGQEYPDIDDLLNYCYHVAGSVGVMMAHVLGVRDRPTLDRACDLGIAFQLTNIARDVIDDASIGRVYLPRLWLKEAGIAPAEIRLLCHRPALASIVARMLAVAEPYYASAGIGIAQLPKRSAWAIGTAHAVYREIGMEVLRRGPHAWDRRVSTSKSQKLAMVLRGGMAAINCSAALVASRDGLWTHAL
jgi:15-cis-phytoene synthase